MRAKAARARAAEAEATLGRIEAAQRALPAKISETDSRITAASEALTPISQKVRASVLDDYAAELERALKAFAAGLMRGHALAAAGLGMSQHLNDIVIACPLRDRAPTLRGATLQLRKEVVHLNSAWQERQDAIELHAVLEPLQRTMTRLASHLLRMEQDQEYALRAANEKARNESFRRGYGTPPMKAPEPEPSPKSTFKPGTYRQPGTPVPTEMSLMHAAHALPSDPAVQ